MSMFSFITGSKSSSSSSHPETDNASSIFGGMSVSATSATIEESATHNEGNTATASNGSETSLSGSSGFSFLVTPAADHSEIFSAPSGSSTFSFIAESGSNNNMLLHESLHSKEDQDIKLTRVASTKTVKKKKKSTARVGFARDGTEDDDVDEESPRIKTGHNHISSESAENHRIGMKSNPDQDFDMKAAREVLNPPPAPSSVPPPVPEEIVQSVLAYSRGNSPSPQERSSGNELATHIISVPNSNSSSDANIMRPGLPNKYQEILAVPKIAQKIQPNEPLVSQIDEVKASVIPQTVVINTQREQVIPIQNTFVNFKPIKDEEVKLVASIFSPALEVEKISSEALINLNDSFERMSQRLISINKEISQSQREINRMESKIVEAKSKLEEFEKEQQRVVALEDFETADKINEAIEDMKKQVSDLNNSTISMKATVINLEEQKLTNRRKQIEQLISTMAVIGDATKTEEQILSEILLKVDKVNDEERQKLDSEAERIEMERKQIEKEDSSLQEETSEIENTIRTQCGDISESKSLLELELSTLSNEIAELEKILEAKRSSEKQLKTTLSSLDQRIQEIRRKYDRQLNRIQERRDLLEKTRYEWSLEKNTLTESMEKFNLDVENIDGTKAELNSKLKSFNDQLSIIVIVETALRAIMDEKNVHNSESNSSSYESLFSSLTLAEIELENSLNTSLDMKNKMEALRLESSDILEEKIPKLENEKKNHATAKRFKEAATAAKDIKSFTTRREEIEEELKVIASTILDMEKEIDILRSKRDDALTRFREVQLAIDKIRLEVLVRHIKILKCAKKKIHKIQALPSGSSDRYLETEIASMIEEVQEINLKHNLPTLDIEDDDTFMDNQNETANDAAQEAELGGKQKINFMEDISPQENGECNDNSNYGKVTAIETINEETPDKEDLLKKQDELLSQIDALNTDLKNATDSEDYENAATIYDEIQQKNELLASITVKLGTLE